MRIIIISKDLYKNTELSFNQRYFEIKLKSNFMKVQVEEKKVSLERESSFGGLNFVGQAKLLDQILSLDITQFKKGKCYFIQIDNNTLLKDSKNYLFRETINLYDQLMDNKLLEINDEGCLIIPIQVPYKKIILSLSITISLKGVQFQGEEEKHKLYSQIARVYKQKMDLQKIAKNFQNKIIKGYQMSLKMFGDITNPQYKSFEITSNGRQIKMIGKNIYTNFNHCLPLPNFGLYCFKFKILKTNAKYIVVGICANIIKGEVNRHKSPYFIGMNIYDGNIYSNKESKSGALGGIKMIEGKSIFKLEIDMNQKLLKWYMDDKQLCQEKINQKLQKMEICPLVNLYHQGDTIEFVD